MDKTALIVDDDNDGRLLLCKMVERLGFKTVDFPSGDSALKAITGQTFTLALLDIMMPDMNGYELLQKIRAMPEFQDLPVVMVTARDGDTEILEGYKYGANYYITKPYTLEQLKYGIKMVLE